LRRDDMVAQATKVVEETKKDNDVKLLNKLREVVSAEMQRVREEFEAWCKANMPVQDAKQLEMKFQVLSQEGLRNIQGRLTSLPEAQRRPEYQLMLLDGEQMLREYLKLKTIENDSILKDSTIEKLREEAMKRQKLLIEQNKKLEQYLSEEKTNTEAMEKQLADLRRQRQDEEKKAVEQKQLLEKQQKELEELKIKQEKAKKGKCVIL